MLSTIIFARIVACFLCFAHQAILKSIAVLVNVNKLKEKILKTLKVYVKIER